MAKKRKHALLSASGAVQWIHCTPSAKLCDELPDTESAYTKEGTLAHEICELKLTADSLKTGTYTRRMNKIKKNELYQEEMQGFTDQYVDYVETLSNSLSEKPYMAVEKRVEFDKYVPDGFGTADCILICGTVMHVIDFKYGKGVPVNAGGNPQMGLYALGALKAYGFLYPIEDIFFHIVQPRLNNFSTWKTNKRELTTWGNVVVKPKAELAYKGEGEFRSGEHCRFCKVLNCRQRAYDNLELLETYETKLPPELSDEEVGEALAKAEQLVAWHKKLKSYAQTKLIDGGEIPGWKIVEGRSNRMITDYEKMADVLELNGFPKETLYERAQLTLTDLEKMVGKKDFQMICGEFIQKPNGKPTLAPESDKRPAYNPKTTAAEDFK